MFTAVIALLILLPSARATPVCVAALLPQTMHTLRTTIRRTKPADVEPIYRAINKPEFAAMSDVPPLEMIALPRSSKGEERVTFTIWDRSIRGKRVVGSIRFDFLDPAENKHFSFLRPTDRFVSLGYILAPEFWGRGIATEVLRKSLHVFDRDVRPDGYIAYVTADNLASRRILEKLGFEIFDSYKDVFFYVRTQDWPALLERSVENENP